MNPGRLRGACFAIGACTLVVWWAWAFAGLHPVGAFDGAYGRLLASVTVEERHATDAVSAVNFDYRGFDTLGEEFILFSSVVGVALLLRKSKKQEGGRGEGQRVPQHAPDREFVRTSNAVRLASLVLVGMDVVFGLDVIVHGQLTPGGGFQGGVILASAPLLAYLGGDTETLRRVAPSWLTEMGEAIGIGGFLVVGLAGMLAGGRYLQNVVPLGPQAPPDVASSGTIALVSLATGLEVAAAFALLLVTFLEESERRRKQGST